MYSEWKINPAQPYIDLGVWGKKLHCGGDIQEKVFRVDYQTKFDK